MALDEVRQLTAARLAAVEPQDEPFPHAFIQDLFPDAYFREMRANLPPDDALEATDPRRSKNPNAVNRRKFAIDDRHLAAMDEGPRAFWTAARQWLGGLDFTRSVLGRFGPGVAARYGERSLDLFNRIEINVDGENYAIPPHTDSPRKVLTMLVYLPADDSRADLGTAIYKPKNPAFRSENGFQFPVEHFDEVARFPYLPNSCLAFLKTDNSFHGRPPVTGSAVCRPMLVISMQHAVMDGAAM